MEQKYKKSLYVFRRDLRIQDNTALLQASSQSKSVVVCFIADERQISSLNPYRSLNAIQFMCSALSSLNNQIKKSGGHLYVMHGLAHECIKEIIEQTHIDAVFVNQDYTPFSINRDEAIRRVCSHYSVNFHEYHDVLINEPEIIKTANNTPYTLFTPYFKRALKIPIKAPNKAYITNWDKEHYTINTIDIQDMQGSYNNSNIAVTGNHEYGMHILATLDQFQNYATLHDYPAYCTTQLSAHIKFGLISPRTVGHAIIDTLGQSSQLLRQLYWRDFFTYIAYFSPFVFGNPFKEKYTTLSWKTNENHWKAWCDGMTGFPIIDAGMRELNETGYMHNRVRMLTASFLVKDLHIDWRLGEQYFAQHLVDYDPSVNNGNWQWIAGTGADANPYFRVFNPWIQQKKFDPDCTYIYRFIRELSHVNPSKIHTWYNNNNSNIKNYPRPIIDHAKESILAKKMYQFID